MALQPIQGDETPSVQQSLFIGRVALPFVIPSEAEGSAVRPSAFRTFRTKPQPPNKAVILSEAPRGSIA